MTQDDIKELKKKSIIFLLVGIFTFIVSFLIPFLCVFSAMAFYVSFENYKEYKQFTGGDKKDGKK